MKTILLTGAAGFIAARTGEILLERGVRVVGVDNMNNFYDVRLKEHRLNELREYKNFNFYKYNIEDQVVLERLFKKYKFDAVINLAAQAGVRHSMINPFIYMATNVNGTLNLLEQCRKWGVKKFVLASSSSLYAGEKMPFKESLKVNTPSSPYAASKKAAEMIAYVYHHLHSIDVTVLRYFTTYGPAGRPDMSPFRFIKAIAEDKPIQLFGDGSQSRSFVYVDDIARGTVMALKKVGYRVINLGGNGSYSINQMIRLFEKFLCKKAKIEKRAFSKIDMKATRADISEAQKTLRWSPKVNFEQGIKRTVDWYLANKSWLSKVKM